MNRKMKNMLKDCFAAPEPERKRDFINSIRLPAAGWGDFLLSQAAYIRKWVWGISLLLFAIAMIGGKYMEKDMLWFISALMPLLAMALITESGRSELWGMAEFELSARFSLKSIVLARLGILGIADLLLFCLLLPLAFMNGGVSPFQAGIYMLCPYLLTVFLGLWVSRRVHGRESVYLCAGIALGVGLADALLYQSVQTFYAWRSFHWWLAAFVLLSAGAADQCIKTIKQREELVWSLQ